jgi:hypothetical protein
VILAAPPAAGGAAAALAMAARALPSPCAGAWAGAIWAFDLNPFFAKGPGDVFDALCTRARRGRDARRHRRRRWPKPRCSCCPAISRGSRRGRGSRCCWSLCPASRARHAAGHRAALRADRDDGAAGRAVARARRGGHHRPGRGHGLLPDLRGLPARPATGAGAGDGVLDSYAAGPLTRLDPRAHPGDAAGLLRLARMAVPASVLAVTVVEWLATGIGIGSLMALSASLSDYDMLWSRWSWSRRSRRSATPSWARSSGASCPLCAGAAGMTPAPRRLCDPRRHHDADRRLHLRAPPAGGAARAGPRHAPSATGPTFPDPTPPTWPTPSRSWRRSNRTGP